MITMLRRIPAIVLLGLAVLTAGAASASPLDTVFDGYSALASKNWSAKVPLLKQWVAMAERFKKQQADCQPAVGCAKFKALAGDLAGLSLPEQLKKVKADEAGIPYVKDSKNYNVNDYWATPYETLSKGSGDTEDDAILAYYALRAAGVPAASMRVMAVYIKVQKAGRAILVVDTTPKPLILSDLEPKVMSVQQAAVLMQPLLGFDEDGWWYYSKTAQ
jgi:predicted transglutaminase-like cysteine proteinase